MRAMASIVGALGLTVAIVALGAPEQSFVDLPSALFVGGATALVTGGAHGFGAMMDGLRGRSRGGRDGLARARRALDTARRAAWGSGAVGTLVGAIQIFQKVDDPAALGPAVAVCLFTLFYAAVLAELVVTPLRGRLVEAEALDRS